MMGRRTVQAGHELLGLIVSEGCLYTVERQEMESLIYSHYLAVYQIHSDSGDLKMLNRLELWTGVPWSVCPRVESHSQRVFVPCLESGVTIARLDGDRLLRERTLTCVREAVSVGAMSPDTVYVCDRHSIHVVDVRDDRITLTLQKPDTVKAGASRLAVLGDNVMVSYTDGTLVVYHQYSPTPVMIANPGGLKYVTAINTDCQRHFMLAYSRTNSVFVMDVSGNIRHTVNIDTDSYTQDCAVVNGQLWVGCQNGDIVIMSTQ